MWDPADVGRVVESYLGTDELPALYMELPRATYATWQYDAVHDDQGKPVGVLDLHRPHLERAGDGLARSRRP